MKMGRGERVKGRWGSWKMVNYLKKLKIGVYIFKKCKKSDRWGLNIY
jgi:hypothetical protein